MHQGKLVAQYRENLGMTQEELADEMDVHVRTVQKLESRAMIRSTARRWFLVGLLGIPASQLGLQGEPPWSKKRSFPVSDDTMGFFEHEMAMRWHVFQSSGLGIASRGMDIWTTQLKAFEKDTQGTPWHKRTLTVLSLSYQLEGSIFREKLSYTQADEAFQHAFQAAYEAENKEQMASTLLREGMVSMAQKHPFQAIEYFNGALDHVKGQGFPRLRGKLLQARAEAYAVAQRPQDCWGSIGLAEHILGREEKGHEQSQVLFSPSSVVMWKGLCALLLQDYERALTLFEKGLNSGDSTLIPDRARFLSRKAEACYGAGKIGECLEAAQEAFIVASSIGKESTIERVSHLHEVLRQSRWSKELGMKSLGASLTQCYSTTESSS